MFFNRRMPSHIRLTYQYDSLGGILWGLFYGLGLYFFVIVARTIGASDTQVVLLTMTPFFAALFTFYWSHHSSRQKKMPFLIKMKIFAGTSLLFTCLATNAWVYVALITLFWMFDMATSPAYTGIMRDIYPTEHRGKAMGYVRVEMGLASILAAYVGGELLDLGPGSYRWVFPLGALFYLASLASFRRIKVESDNRVKAHNRTFSFYRAVQILKEDKRLLGFLLIFFLTGSGNILTLPLYPILVVDILHLSKAVLGRVGALFSVFWVLSYLLWGELVDKRGPLEANYITALLWSLMPLAYFLANFFPERAVFFIYAAAIVSGLALGGRDLSRLNFMTRIAGEHNVQDYWGIDFTFMGIRGIIFPFVGILLKNAFGIGWAFTVSFLLMLAGFLAMLHFNHHHKKDPELIPYSEKKIA